MLESEAMIKLIAQKNSFVMAAGGGTPCFLDGMKIMNESGVTVYLETPIEVLINRTKRKEHRPLLGENHVEKMRELLNTREICYSQAHYALQTADLGLKQKVDGIIKLLAE